MFSRFAIVLIGFFAASLSFGQTTYTYIGPDGGVWSDPNNWSPMGVPATNSPNSGDSILISSSIPITTVDDIGTVNELTATGPINFQVGGTTKYLSANQMNVNGAIFNDVAIATNIQLSTFSNVTLTNCSWGGPLLTFTGTNSFQNSSIEVGPANWGISGNNTLDHSTLGAIDGFSIDGTVNATNNGYLGGDYVYINPGSTTNLTDSQIGATFWINITGTSSAPTTMNMMGASEIVIDEPSGPLQIGNGSAALSSPDVFLNQYSGQIVNDEFYTEQTNFGPNSEYNLSGGSQSGGAIAFAGIVNQTGGAIIADSETISGIFSQTGGINNQDVYPQSLAIASGGTYKLCGGTLNAYHLANAGTFLIDLKNVQSSQMTAHDFSQTTSGVLDLTDLTPSAAAILIPAATLSLDGTFEIALDPSYTPNIGDVFMLLQAPSLMGTFADYEFPYLPANWYFQPVYTPTTFSLDIVPEPASFCGLAGVLVCMGRRRKIISRAGRNPRT